MRSLRQATNVICPLVVLSSAAWSGNITGAVRHYGSGSPAIRVPVRAYSAGRSLGIGASTDNDGRFLISDLPAGTYAVCVTGSDSSRPRVAAVTVRSQGDSNVRFVVGSTAEVDGDSWVQAQPVFYQSFRATGVGVTSLRLKAFGPARAVHVQLLEGDGPSGKPIGPSRTTVAFGGEGEAAVYWSGGEAPTVPGKTYTFRLAAEPGQAWIAGMAGRGDVYPLGSAWFGREPRPLTDLGFTTCEENDDLATIYAVAAGRRAIRVRAVGQTFIPRGKSILYASACLSGINSRAVYVRFSIHESGPGGKQIGPSKGTGAGMDSAVAWLPGEVQVTPGKTYYLHIESFDGALFHAYEVADTYAKGSAFNDGRAAYLSPPLTPTLSRPTGGEGAGGTPPREGVSYDLAGWIAGDISEADRNLLLASPRSVKQVAMVNSSFEDGLQGWTLTKSIGAITGCDGGVIPACGQRMFGWTNFGKGEGDRTIVYQTVKVTPGKQYSFSGSVFTDHAGGRSSDQKVRLVLDASGRMPFNEDSMQSSQWYATEGEWRRGSVEFVAKAASVAVGFELEQRWSLDMCSLYVDGARLEEVAAK